MTGYEDLSPDQLIYLAQMGFYCVIIVVSGLIVKAFIQFRTARYIHFRIEKDIVASITEEIIEKKSFITTLKEWWKERQKRKEENALNKFF